MKAFIGAKRLMYAAAAAAFVLAAAGAASAAESAPAAGAAGAAFETGAASAPGSGDQSSDEAWDEAFALAYAAALAGAPFEPSALALRIVEAETSALRRDWPPEAAASRVLELSLCAESALRFGSSPQETRALIRARLRFDGPGPSASRFSKELGRSLKASASGGAKGAAAPGGFGGFGGRGRR
ncbi:MAG TPA: hypothetical protein P5165_07465 [Spirochaetia bacterium]|nr:hypothetical protein [Spirochaetales bacterium]HRY73045.1 hypothetical protein [Spirochaetia bacterium]